jgi:mycofactocin precursor
VVDVAAQAEEEIMDEQKAADSPAEAAAEQVPAETLVEADDLVEEVSIDGMCGVY